MWLFSLGWSLKVNLNEAVKLRSETTGETENCSARSIAGIKHHLCHHDRLVTQYSRLLAVKTQLYKFYCLLTPLHLVFKAKKMSTWTSQLFTIFASILVYSPVKFIFVKYWNPPQPSSYYTGNNYIAIFLLQQELKEWQYVSVCLSLTYSCRNLSIFSIFMS